MTALRRGFNTSVASEPATLFEPESGLRISLVAYSSTSHSATRFNDPASCVHFGDRAIEGGPVHLVLRHAGARLDVEYLLSSDGVRGTVVISELPEWALRYWFVLQIGSIDADLNLLLSNDHPYDLPPRLDIRSGAKRFTMEWDTRPVDVLLHDRFEEIEESFLSHGYYHRIETSASAKVASFRFNALTEAVAFSVMAESGSVVAPDGVQERVRTAPIHFPETFATSAVSSALGWGVVWDFTHGRPIVASSRRWIDSRFGGWNVWQIDLWSHAVMAARVGEFEVAFEILSCVDLLVHEGGNLAALMSGSTRWVDRNHPPLGAMAAFEVGSASGEWGRIRPLFDLLLRDFRWWFETRDANGNGLLELGSSPVGDGHFVHTLQAAMDEASMDNSAVWEGFAFDPQMHTMNAEDVGLNSLLALQGEYLCAINEAASFGVELRWVSERVGMLRTLIPERLWDEGRGVFAARGWDGTFSKSLAPTSFYPLLAAAGSSDQFSRMVDRLDDPSTFGGGPLVPSTDRAHPAASENTYWRGRIWSPFNLLVYSGLRRQGFEHHATEVALSSYRLLKVARDAGTTPENFPQDSYRADTGVDCEPQYTWGAMMALPVSMEVLHIELSGVVHFGLTPSAYSAWSILTGERRFVARRWLNGLELCAIQDTSATVLEVGGVVVVELEGPVRGRFAVDSEPRGHLPRHP